MVKKEEVAGPSEPPKEDEEGEDYCSSASSWVPSDEDAQSDGDSVEVTAKLLLICLLLTFFMVLFFST